MPLTRPPSRITGMSSGRIARLPARTICGAVARGIGFQSA
jgi:hypothetical protein